MINNINSALSGLLAHNKKTEVTANNVANINTDDFKKSRALLQEETNGEVTVDIQKIETPGVPIVYTEGEEKTSTETSNVDYTEETVSMITTSRGFEANLKVIQTEDEMLGSLLDIIV